MKFIITDSSGLVWREGSNLPGVMAFNDIHDLAGAKKFVEAVIAYRKGGSCTIYQGVVESTSTTPPVQHTDLTSVQYHLPNGAFRRY